jgi:hypothetical protein
MRPNWWRWIYTRVRRFGSGPRGGDQYQAEYPPYDAKGGEQDTLPPIEVRACGIIEEVGEFLADLDPWQEPGKAGAKAPNPKRSFVPRVRR